MKFHFPMFDALTGIEKRVFSYRKSRLSPSFSYKGFNGVVVNLAGNFLNGSLEIRFRRFPDCFFDTFVKF